MDPNSENNLTMMNDQNGSFLKQSSKATVLGLNIKTNEANVAV